MLLNSKSVVINYVEKVVKKEENTNLACKLIILKEKNQYCYKSYDMWFI